MTERVEVGCGFSGCSWPAVKMWEPVPYRLPGVRWDPASAAENITHYVGSQNALNTVFELECIIQQKMRCAGVVVHSSSVQSVQCIKFVPWENKFIFIEHCGHLKKKCFCWISWIGMELTPNPDTHRVWASLLPTLRFCGLGTLGPHWEGEKGWNWLA